MNRVWTIRLTMGSPVVLSTKVPLVGDALLSAAEARRRWPRASRTRQPVPGVDWEARLPIPVAEDTGHWATSVVGFEGPAYAEPDRFYKTAESRVVREKEAGSGYFKMAIYEFTAWTIPQLVFDVEVRPDQEDALAQLITRYLPRITVGSLGRMGYGRIIHAAWEPSPNRSAVWTPQGQPRRPWRLASLPPGWHRDPDQTVIMAMRAEPPRWWGPIEWCVVPHPHTWIPQQIITRGRPNDSQPPRPEGRSLS